MSKVVVMSIQVWTLFKQNIRKQARLLVPFGALLTLVAFPFVALANTSAIQIAHRPPGITDLPPAGHSLQLDVRLLGTRQFDLPLRMIATLDDRLLDLTITESVWDSQDRPTYTFQLYAPIKEISYQFILTAPDGSLVGTPTHRVRRACVPDIEPVEQVIDETRPLGAQSLELFQAAEKLDRELAAYERAYQTASNLVELLKEYYDD